MPICPYCKTNINTLDCEERVWATYPMSLKNDNVDFGKGEIIDVVDEDGDNRHYKCSNCSEEITDSYSNAEAFLRGEVYE